MKSVVPADFNENLDNLANNRDASDWDAMAFSVTSLWFVLYPARKITIMRTQHLDDLAQDYSNYSTLAMELLQFCPKPSI